MYYEDRIADLYKTQAALKSQELFSQVNYNYKLIPFYAVFRKILSNKVKKRNRDIDLLSKVNDQIMQMISVFESSFIINL